MVLVAFRVSTVLKKSSVFLSLRYCKCEGGWQDLVENANACVPSHILARCILARRGTGNPARHLVSKLWHWRDGRARYFQGTEVTTTPEIILSAQCDQQLLE